MNVCMPWRQLLLSVLFWVMSGVVILCGINVVHSLLTNMPITPGSLGVSAVLGIFAGSLFGTGDIRLKLLNLRLAREEEIEQLAYNDNLTGLPNRALLDDRLLNAIAKARRVNHQLGVFFFDIDRFKMINDTQGHAVGDLILRSVAQRLKKFIREGDTFARLGGDEFVIVQADPNHDPNFAVMARRILETLAEPFLVGSREIYTSASIGIAVYPCDGDTPTALLKSADTAMYVAKDRGRNNFQFFSSEMNTQAVSQAEFETRLRQALLQQELSLYYQPQYDLGSGRIVAVEALLRWHDETGREIPSTEIIRIAEESGLIYPLGRWVLESAARQAVAWQADGLPPLRMAVNISGHQIRQGNFIDQIDQILGETGLPAEQLELELNETAMMSHLQELLPTLTDLKVRGLPVAIDEFGTGYSSLLYLTKLPLQRIKIPPEFILDVTHNRDHKVITKAIIDIANRLGLQVTAVGVETLSQLEFLRRHGCKEAAGLYLSPPLCAEEIPALCRNNQATLLTDLSN
jgi:diguanylate cyclase (GGDEF)-like protein